MTPRRIPFCAPSDPRPTAAGWFALAIVGQVALLRAIEAGPFVRYGHLLRPDRWPAWVAAVLLLETALVGWGAWRRRAAIAKVVRGRSTLRIGLFGVVFAGTAAALSRSLPWYATELVLATTFQAVSLGAVAFGATSLPEGAGREVADRVLGEGPERPRLDRFGWILAAWATAVALLLAVVVYERHPHVPDEVGYLLHASYLAEGRLAMDAPPVPEAFDVDLMHIEGDRWYSPTPPGWPAALAVGAWLGAPWIVNPIATGIIVLLAYLLTWRLYDRPTARVTAALLAASPWLLFLGMSVTGDGYRVVAGPVPPDQAR